MKQKSGPKFIFVVGGVISGVGKGIAASSIGRLLKNQGLTVTAVKVDPYVNVDAGTMNPTEHGEVFVLDDGDECDQDMGNYERFLDTTLTRTNYMTTGRVYQSVINNERALRYGGKCVQVVPHIPLEIIGRIKTASKNANADVTIVEIGGTVGEYENILFLEAARMMKLENPKDVLFVMVSYLPVPSKVGEMKTKPTQHASRILNSNGIQPDIIIARSATPLDEKRKEKISFFCNVPIDRVISAPDVGSVYDVPNNFDRDGLSQILCDLLYLSCAKGETKEAVLWNDFIKKTKKKSKEVKIAVVGKYFDTGDFTLSDSYLSVIEAVKYSAYALGAQAKLSWINAIDFEKNPRALKKLNSFDGVIIPGGFGSRGVEGKIAVIKYLRENKIPFFGLCYGMQLSVIEYARHVAGILDATTAEISKQGTHVVAVLPEQVERLAKENFGNSMRLGGYDAVLTPGTQAYEAYGTKKIRERHRHRYEVVAEFLPKLTKAGLVFSGMSEKGNLPEIAELPKKVHPFFVATQFHPEFLARPLHPHPLFTAFIKASLKRKK
jgi:CTP synthase